MAWLSDPAIWASLLTLTALEIVLGIDNIIFISIVAGRLPDAQQPKARLLGLSAALVLRIVFLSVIAWIAGLKEPLFTLLGTDFSWRSLILLAGGLFLLGKSTVEIHHSVEGEAHEAESGGKAGLLGVVLQIIVLDIVFSLDSVITAIGMAEHLAVMIAAVCIAMVIMMAASGPVSHFVNTHPTTKMLAMSFLLLVGMSLVADGLHFHIPRGYLYFAVAFSMGVEVLNLLAARRRRAQRAARTGGEAT